MQRPLHAELRDLSGKSLLESSHWLCVSIGHLSNCERGLAKLTREQDAALCSYYAQRIAERTQRLAAAITADAEVSSDQQKENS